MRARRWVLAGVALLAVIAGCGRNNRPPVSFPPVPDHQSASSSAPPAGPWVAACTRLTDAEVASAANGHGTQITVERHTAQEQSNEANGRMSTCMYYLAGQTANERLTGGGIELR